MIWFPGFPEVNTVDTCTVPTSTESITTAWTLSVTTRWARELHCFFLRESRKYTVYNSKSMLDILRMRLRIKVFIHFINLGLLGIWWSRVFSRIPSFSIVLLWPHPALSTLMKSCLWQALSVTIHSVLQASSGHSWSLTVGLLSQGLIINMIFFFSSLCAFFKRHLLPTGGLLLIPFHVINLVLVPGAAVYDTRRRKNTEHIIIQVLCLL